MMQTAPVDHAVLEEWPYYSTQLPHAQRRLSGICNKDSTWESALVVPPAPLFSKGHKRDTSDMSSATVQIGMRMSTIAVEPGVEEPFGRSEELISWRDT
jgi:hypothetical protein